MFRTVACIALFAMTSETYSQNFAPPKTTPPSEETVKALRTKLAGLTRAMQSLRRQGLRDPGLADVEIYERGVRMILDHGEFFHKDSVAWTEEAIDRGTLRARLLSQGEMPWSAIPGYSVARGYRSRIDGSVQPYSVAYPVDFGKTQKRFRVDIVLHGRDSSLTEVKFLHSHNGDRKYGEAERVQIEIFGRGNNAYRWAGETDVFEAMDAFWSLERASGRDRFLDPTKIVLRGFSMGGAGTWHLGLHHPDRWSVIGPGAGFSTTHGYVGKLPERLASPQEECLSIYDAVGYAENAFHVPIVAYSGAKDPQKKAADLIEERLTKLGLPMTHLVAPDVEHAFPAEWQKKANALWSEHVAKPRPDYVQFVRFTTYTLKYPTCQWVEILGLEEHYRQARVQAERTEDGYKVRTGNVRQLHITLPSGVNDEQTVAIDDQTVKARPWMNAAGFGHLYLAKKEGRWRSVLPQRLAADRARFPQKSAGLTGPIDEAFCDSFLCIRGTGKAWHDATANYAKADLESFAKEWSKHMRGDLPVKDDEDVTPEDFATKHLILFGDPSSNRILGEALDGLPLAWTKDEIRFGGKTYEAASHVPVLIFPNPLNPAKYVVVNSGHTFHAAEFEGTNALLYPRLGDWALLKLKGGGPLEAETVRSGLFDEFWSLK